MNTHVPQHMFALRNNKNIDTSCLKKVPYQKLWYTVDSCYLQIQGTLWNTSRYQYFDISDLRNRGKQLIIQPPSTEWISNLTPKLEIYWKYCEKEEKLFLRSSLFHNILLPVVRSLCYNRDQIFTSRWAGFWDKRGRDNEKRGRDNENRLYFLFENTVSQFHNSKLYHFVRRKLLQCILSTSAILGNSWLLKRDGCCRGVKYIVKGHCKIKKRVAILERWLLLRGGCFGVLKYWGLSTRL